MNRFPAKDTCRMAAIASVACMAIALTAPAKAEERAIPDTYLAATTNMTPADVELKADILHWSTDEERAGVVAALGSDDPSAALGELPSMGAIWRSNSSVGNAIKYAHRTRTPDGAEVVTLVTDRRIGYSHFIPWEADAPVTDESPEYSVIEMVVGGDAGYGTMSLSADIRIDTANNLISLEPGDGEPLLTNARMAPKPYWASDVSTE
jgi:hypothetical protein